MDNGRFNELFAITAGNSADIKNMAEDVKFLLKRVDALNAKMIWIYACAAGVSAIVTMVLHALSIYARIL